LYLRIFLINRISESLFKILLNYIGYIRRVTVRDQQNRNGSRMYKKHKSLWLSTCGPGLKNGLTRVGNIWREPVEGKAGKERARKEENERALPLLPFPTVGLWLQLLRYLCNKTHSLHLPSYSTALFLLLRHHQSLLPKP